MVTHEIFYEKGSKQYDKQSTTCPKIISKHMKKCRDNLWTNACLCFTILGIGDATLQIPSIPTHASLTKYQEYEPYAYMAIQVFSCSNGVLILFNNAPQFVTNSTNPKGKGHIH